MHPLSIMIKPVSSTCNMRCKYCFYFDEAENREIKNHGFMSEGTLKLIVKKALKFAVGSVTFFFQGGEPTLIDLKFYESLIKFVKKYNERNIKVSYAIQTNGYNISEDYARFFKKHNFLVGLSLDGPSEINDKYRISINKEGTYKNISKTIEIFNKYKVDYNILCVVTKDVVENIEEVYEFYKENNLNFQQYIPCIEPIGEKRGETSYGIDASDYLEFLKKVFDLWYRDIKNGRLISIRYFDDIINTLVFKSPSSCTMAGSCAYYYAFEASGDVYPCDFYMLDEYKIGNIKQDDFSKFDKNQTDIKFIESSRCHHEECKTCKWHFLCGNGCMRDRDNNKTYLCKAYKEFLEYSYERFIEIIEMIKRRNNR